MPNNGFCVENKDTRTAVFVVTARDGSRKLAVLASGERLCTNEFDTPTGGFVSVFYDEDAVEGCSRLTPSGTVQVLLKYHDFDNCAWQISP